MEVARDSDQHLQRGGYDIPRRDDNFGQTGCDNKARWLHPTESVEAERRARSERSKRMAEAWTPEQRAHLIATCSAPCGPSGSRKALRQPDAFGAGESRKLGLRPRVIRLCGGGAKGAPQAGRGNAGQWRGRGRPIRLGGIRGEVGSFNRRRHIVHQYAAYHLLGPCRSPRNRLRVSSGEGRDPLAPAAAVLLYYWHVPHRVNRLTSVIFAVGFLLSDE